MEAIEWTPKLLKTTLEKYVMKGMLSEENKAYISKQPSTFDPLETLKHLINHSNGRLDFYGPADCLLKDLEEILKTCEAASLFLGNTNGIYYGIGANFREYYSKLDAPLIIYRFLKQETMRDKPALLLILKSHGNRIYRKLWNCNEHIEGEDLKKFLQDFNKNYEDFARESHQKNDDFRLTKYSVDEVGYILSKFFDVQNDEELLKELRDYLIDLSKRYPIRSKSMFYKTLYEECAMFSSFLKFTIEKNPHIFSPKNRTSSILRIFYSDDEDEGWILMDDLEYYAVKKGVNLSSYSRRKEDMILTVTKKNLPDLLEKIENFKIIRVKIQKTSTNWNIPIMTISGKHCKLALETFNEILQCLTLDLRWFDSVPARDFYKVNGWMEMHDVFDIKIQEIYFIATLKMDEIVRKLYEELSKFVPKEKKYEIPCNFQCSTLEDVKKELDKVSPFWKDLNQDITQLETNALGLGDPPFKKRNILNFHSNKRILGFIKLSAKIPKFFFQQKNPGIPYAGIQLIQNMYNPKTYLHSDDPNVLQNVYFEQIFVKYFEFLREFNYFLALPSGLIIYDNDYCLKLVLEESLEKYPKYRKIFELIYEVEYKKAKKSKEMKVFYLQQYEVEDFCQKMKLNIQVEDNQNKKKTGNFFWKKDFQLNDYPYEFHRLMQELRCEFCIEVKEYFWKCFEEMKCLKNYKQDRISISLNSSAKRRIYLRTMCEMRIEDQKEWHLFSEEVLEAFQIVLNDEKKLDESIERQLKKWEDKWKMMEFGTISVKLFETCLEVLKINKSQFCLIPDFDYAKNLVELPLRMGYDALKIQSPDRRWVYHQVQAHYLIFQFGACDIFWLKYDLNINITRETIQRAQQSQLILFEMQKIGKGYNLAEKVEESVENVKYSHVMQKTPLSWMHGKSYDLQISNKHLNQLLKCMNCPPNLSNRLELVFQKYEMLLHWIICFCAKEHPEMKRILMKAVTVSMGTLRIANMQEFEDFYQGNNIEDPCDLFLFDFCIEQAHFINSNGTNLDENPFIEKHYLFDDNDPLAMYGPQKRKHIPEKSNIEKIKSFLPKVVEQVCDEQFEPIEKLWELFEKSFGKHFDPGQKIKLCQILPTLKAEFEKDPNCELEFQKIDEKEMFKRKKKIIQKEAVKKTREEVKVKYVTQTKIIENCEKCQNIEKETMEYLQKLEYFEKENVEKLNSIRQKDEDLMILKNLIGENKMKYREEIQKIKEDVGNKDLKIEQLQIELKQQREDLRIEREKLYKEVRQTTRESNENVKKLKIELENEKLLGKTRANKNEELSAEVQKLKTMLEISEENKETTKDFKNICAKFNIYEIIKKVSRNSEIYGICQSEIVGFLMDFENSQNVACFSNDFMQKYEECMKIYY